MDIKRFCTCLAAAAAFTVSALEGQSVCDAPQAREFDFWIGEWNVVNKRLTEEGWAEMGRAAAKVYPILGGCALVEHWRGTAWGNKTIGFSVRNFDPETGKWFLLLSWPGQNRPGFGTLEGTFTHGRGEFFRERETPEGETSLTRYSFSDTKPDALRWDAAESKDGGGNWQTYWIMEFSRRDAGSLPLFHGPWIGDGRKRHCSQPEAAELDALAGAWRGTEKSLGPDGEWSERDARVAMYPILEGCALMDFTEVTGEGGYERFGIRAWVQQESRWGQYEIETGRPRFVRTLGIVEQGRVTLMSEEEGSTRVRVLWDAAQSGALVREDARSSDGGASWEVHRKLELMPVAY